MSRLPKNLNGLAFPQEDDKSTGYTESVDTLTGNMVFINHNHMETHDGGRFYAVDYVTGIGSGVTYTYVIKTGSQSAHFIYGYSASAEALVSFYEGSVVPVSGNDYAIPFNCRNRVANASVANGNVLNSTMLCHVSGSVTTNGTLLDINDDQAGALGSGGSPTYPPDRDDNEWILAPNTVYTVQVKTFSSGEHWSIWFDIYEV
jgi:hypothetical protein